MGGPIVRTGSTPQYEENWKRIFGGKADEKPQTDEKAKDTGCCGGKPSCDKEQAGN